MDAAQLLKQARLDEALAALQDQVRNDPASAKHRVFLFQLLAVLGRWDKALTQLNVAAEVDPKNLMMAQVCREALQCEVLRAAVYAGKRTPLVFGKPDEWVGWLVQANQLIASGNHAQGLELRDKAFEAAPAIAGNVNGKPFEWLADADPRMGPVLEAVVDGKYFWIPMHNIRQIKLDPPQDLRDVVWMPASFLWANGGSAVGLIPARYPGSQSADDPAVKLARKTDWQTIAPGLDIPFGQRLFSAGEDEYPIFEVRQLTFGEAIPDEPPPDPSGQAAADPSATPPA